MKSQRKAVLLLVSGTLVVCMFAVIYVGAVKPIDGVEAIWLSVERIDIVFRENPASEPEVITISQPEFPFLCDLLVLQDGVLSLLGITELPEGFISEFRLVIEDAWIVIKGVVYPLIVPRGVVKLVGELEVVEDELADIGHYFDENTCIIYNKSHGYMLRPAIRFYQIEIGLE